LYYLTAFIAGAVLMGLELLGSRILAPFFGNSIFVWGALISVFLLSLSVGYFTGGVIADRFPRGWILGAILIICGALTASLPSYYPVINEHIFRTDFGYKWNPLIASAVLFILPGALLGMVSPYCIKLTVRELAQVGNAAGKIYAVSTAGSIAGTVGTAFFLIPSWGTKTNLVILSVLLFLCGSAIFLESLLKRNAAANSTS